ncbi:nucleolar complex protein 4 [Lineolata rhizophorae]|uniref:Nucleolar complex protein 4 n=1 Tax=Lineolata rhizophorae TaxID=578093 RepID=A0A6A6P7S3_9PEZI|nr:nucleolar complex protein 4 [Lineolata rhizophorae]
MPLLAPTAVAGKKRKRDNDSRTHSALPPPSDHGTPRAPPKPHLTQPYTTASEYESEEDDKSDGDEKMEGYLGSEEEQTIPREVDQLERDILSSRRNFNSIGTLLQYAEEEASQERVDFVAIIPLCRVFCRLMSQGNLAQSKTSSEKELIVTKWLQTMYDNFTRSLLGLLGNPEEETQNTALTLLMRLLKEEVGATKGLSDRAWKAGVFSELVFRLVTSKRSQAARDYFVERYVNVHDDVRFYTFQSLASILSRERDYDNGTAMASNTIAILSGIAHVPEDEDDLNDFFADVPPKKHPVKSLGAHKKHAQHAWVSLLQFGLDKAGKKCVLRLFTTRVVPWFNKPELLMDFLTDSYNVGGSTSLLALSGLFYLMQEKNLDYPSFYAKLYSLLDEGALHSKHRSRFFRLLETFMASTHLPAALVASFIKRLSRLALYAPPAGIVIVIPWVYNMLKAHPTCSFMVHREIRDPEVREEIDKEGLEDPFEMNEPDPMETGAIESSLWELQTLQAHYHPNVATLAKIISEQFTKRSYNLEDFLDHSYDGMVDAELRKELKKAPVGEYEIPKRIYTDEGNGLGQLGRLMENVGHI